MPRPAWLKVRPSAACRTRGSAGDRAAGVEAWHYARAMQPLAELTLTRPWHWGIAVLGDPEAEVPTKFDGRVVATGLDVVTLSLRHAQDIEADRFEGDWEWATATMHLRSLVREEATDRHVLCDTVIATAQETVSLGDADGMLVIPVPSVRTRLIVSAEKADPTGLETVWVDLVAVDD